MRHGHAGKGLDLHRAARLKVVVRVDLAREHQRLGKLHLAAGHDRLHLHGLGGGGVAQRGGEAAVRGAGRALLHQGQAARLVAAAAHARVEERRALVDLVQVKDVVGGREHHLRAVGEDDGLQDVDGLGDVGHAHAVGVLVEQVQRQRGDHGVAHGVLLVEEAGVRAGLHVVPGAPLVHHERDALLRVVLVHDRAMAGEQRLHEERLAQRHLVLLAGEVRGAALVVPVVGGRGVVVQGEAVHVRAGVLHQDLGPVVVRVAHVRARAAGDLEDLLFAVLLDVALVAAVEVRVVLRPHVAAAAPVLVAHAEVVDLPGLGVAVLPAQLGHGGVAAGGHVLDPLGHLLHGAGADVAVDVGLAADLAAELEEFVRAEAVVLHDVAPVRVDDALAVGLGADAFLPVVFVGKAAARPAQNRELDVPERLDHVRAHAVDVRDGAVLAHVEPLVDAAAQVLREVAVDLRLDLRARARGVDVLANHVILSFYFSII